MDQTIGGEDDVAAELIGCAVKIGNSAASFFDEQNACRGVPAIEAEFPEAIEAAGGNGGKIERGGTVAANAVRAQREIVVVMDVWASLALVNGKAGAKQTGGERWHFGYSDFFAVEGGAFTASCGKKLFINGVVNNTGDDLMAVRESNGHTEAGIAVGEIGGAVERVDVPAVLGVMIFAEAFFRGDGVGGEIL